MSVASHLTPNQLNDLMLAILELIEIVEKRSQNKGLNEANKVLKESSDKILRKDFNLLLLRNYQEVTPNDFVETILETITEFSPESKGSDGIDYTGVWSIGVISAFERLLKSKNWVVK